MERVCFSLPLSHCVMCEGYLRVGLNVICNFIIFSMSVMQTCSVGSSFTYFL